MRYNDYEWLAAVIAANPSHEVIGRTRLQMTMKLLQRLRLPPSYGFTIHYCGPDSEELQSDIRVLEQFGLASEEERVSLEGGSYYVIHANPDEVWFPDVSEYKAAIDTMASTDPVVLELAATYDAFRELGADEAEAMERLRRKKGRKCEKGRAEQALDLLRNLGLLKEPALV